MVTILYIYTITNAVIHRLQYMWTRTASISSSISRLPLELANPCIYATTFTARLSKLDFSVSLIKLISSFLYKRKFFVSEEGEMSTPRIMKAGVPQESILSPTLFNMYVNDTPQAIGVHLAPFCWWYLSLCDGTQGGLCPKKTSAWV
jgi:hypothetical protein